MKSTPPLLITPESDYQTLSDLLRDHARIQPDALALRDANTVLSYGALNERIDRVASALQRDGIKPGQAENQGHRHQKHDPDEEKPQHGKDHFVGYNLPCDFHRIDGIRVGKPLDFTVFLSVKNHGPHHLDAAAC